jgi:hypothetical protein
MGAIKMFNLLWMGFEPSTIDMVGKQLIHALDIDRGRETTTFILKHNFIGSSSMNMYLDHHIESWMVCGTLTNFKY